MRALTALVLCLSACSARPTEKPVDTTERRPEVVEAAPPSTPLPDPTSDDPPREANGDAVPFPAGGATPGNDLVLLEEDHQRARGEVGGHAFVLRRPQGEAEALRLVHCSTARVVRIGSAAANRMSAAAVGFGLPDAGWYVALDPAGQVAGALNLGWYRHLARYHRLDYLGTTPTGLVFYRYLGPRPPLGE